MEEIALLKSAAGRFFMKFNDWSVFEDPIDLTPVLSDLPPKKAFIHFFEAVGAQPKNLSLVEKWWLMQNTNAARADAMRALWGHRFALYKEMLPRYIATSESHSGIVLPKVGDRKTSGPMQFFGLMSAYAFTAFPKDVLVSQLKIRIGNGILWQLGRKDERRKIKDKMRSSISPDFPWAFCLEAISWRDLPWQDSTVSQNDELDDDN